MLIRISLIIAILAGLATAALNFTQVKEKINTTLAELSDTHAKLDKETTDHTKTKKDLKMTQDNLSKTKQDLASAQDAKDAAEAKATDQEKKATAAIAKQKDLQTERDGLSNELAQWRGLNIPIDNIKATLASLKGVTEARDALVAENKKILHSRDSLQDQLDAILHPDKEVPMPGVKGSVLVADPRYDFVVLDIGANQGAKPNGNLLVNRNGKLVAKVKIRTVQDGRSIANVMPGWKLDEIMEGDQVIY